MLFYYTCINFSNVCCRMELKITVAVAFILFGFSLNFFAFFCFCSRLWIWFCIAMLHACNRCYWTLRRCVPIYCGFFPTLIADVVFLYRPIFQRENWPHNSPNFGSFGHSPLLRIHPPFWTCYIWSWLNWLPREVVSIMIRIIMFRSRFAQCIIWCEHFSERGQ